MHPRCSDLYIVEPIDVPESEARWGTQAFETQTAADHHVGEIGRCKVSHWRRLYDAEHDPVLMGVEVWNERPSNIT